MSGIVTDRCPAYSSFFGAMGAASAMVFTGKLNFKTNKQFEFLGLNG